MKRYILPMLGVVFIIACGKKEKKCTPSDVRTLFSEVYKKGDSIDFFVNYVSLDSVDQGCYSKDAAILIAQKYIDSVADRRHIRYIEFFGMDKDFYVGELAVEYDEMKRKFLFGIDLKNGEIDSVYLNKDVEW